MTRVEQPQEETGLSKEFDFPSHWPYIRSENISVGNPTSNVAISTLWSIRDKVTRELRRDDYAIAGQLYERYGINYALRNIFTNPHTRHLIVCGADLSGSGDALVQLWKEGVDDNHNIVGIEKAEIDTEIPSQALNQLRSEVNLIDLRSIKEGALPSELKKVVVELPQLPARGEPEVYPLPRVEVPERLPSRLGAEIVSGQSVGLAWLKILKTVMKFGETVPTNYGNNARDLTNLVSVVDSEDPFSPQMYDFFNFTEEELETFSSAFLNPEFTTDVFYGYGNRMQHYGEHDVNQDEIITMKLKRDPHDRGAIAVLYDPYKDNQLSPDTEDIYWKDFRTPCDVLVQGRVVDGLFVATSYFRSNDMYGGWPRDGFALRRWQGVKAREMGVPVGPLITISSSAHIYQEAWHPVQEKILKDYGSLVEGFEEDPRGNLRVRVEDTDIVVSHTEPASGNPLGPEIRWRGKRQKSTVGLSSQLANMDIFGLYSHALDVGRELMKAEIAAKTGLVYRQDSDAIVKEVVEKLEQLNTLEERLRLYEQKYGEL